MLNWSTWWVQSESRKTAFENLPSFSSLVSSSSFTCHLPPLSLLHHLLYLLSFILSAPFLTSFLPTSLPSSSPSPHLSSLSLHLSLSVSPRPDWWCAEVRQTDGGWGITPASLWHWAPFRPGKWSMLNLILNTPSLTPADRRGVEASVWHHSWGNPIRPAVQVYLQVCLCVLPFLPDTGAICPGLRGELEGATL